VCDFRVETLTVHPVMAKRSLEDWGTSFNLLLEFIAMRQ
jgi:hypothetical protein